MSDQEQMGWLEIDEDAEITGNRVGLIQLRVAIDDALRNGRAAPECHQGERLTVAHVEKPWSDHAGGSESSWAAYLFGSVAFVWFLVLPLVGLYFLIRALI